jgi:hypothetical protein
MTSNIQDSILGAPRRSRNRVLGEEEISVIGSHVGLFAGRFNRSGIEALALI